MANSRIFGLAVPLSLADIPDREQALLNLRLNIDDLEVIRGISAAGFDGNDLQTLSNLDNPIWQTFDRYIADVLTYNTSLVDSAGADFRVRGNLQVNGDISASAFRYVLVDTFATPYPKLRWGDISTSRVSSWSSIGNSISYGSDVKIAGGLGAGKLKTSIVPTERKFAAEVPTHKIRLNLDGTDRFFYVMKGIPISFQGFFRNVDVSIQYISQPTLRPSFRVYDLNAGQPVANTIVDFENVGNQTGATLQYRGITSTTKVVETYLNPELITSITLIDSNIQQLPKTRFNQLLLLNISNNGISNFPDLNFLSPALETLNVSNNPFINGDDPELRFFSKRVRDNIPSTLRSLNIQGCFNGTFVKNALNKFRSLASLSINRGFYDTFFRQGVDNPTGALPNFRGINDGTDGDNQTKTITSVSIFDQDFRTFDNGSQGGVPDTFTFTNGGSGYGPSGNFTGVVENVPLTLGSGSSATATLTVDNGTVVDAEIVEEGTGYSPGDVLSVSSSFAGGSGSGFEITLPSIKEDLIWTMNLKQQPNLVTLNLASNDNLTDNAFQLNCPSTLNTVDVSYTKLNVANCSNFTALTRYDSDHGSGRTTMYGSAGAEWDGTFGGTNYPITDLDQFKFANCTALTQFQAGYSDLGGYLPKFVGCTALTNYAFYAVNNMIAGRPGKRRIISLYKNGGIIAPLGTATPQSPNPNYTPFLQVEVTDTGENSSPATFATLRVTVNSTGNGLSNIEIVNPGSGYTSSMQFTIDGNDLGANGANKDLIISIPNVESGTISSNDYTDGVYTLEDTRANTSVGRLAKVQFEVVGGVPQNFSLEASGQDYQDDEFVTFSTADIGGASDLQVKIFEAEKPKILYADQFSDNPNITNVSIRVINSNGMRGEIEDQVFFPLSEKLSFLRLEFASGAVVGDFPNLETQQALRQVYSASQGWEGEVPSFSSAFNLREVYLNDNKFTGEFFYENKSNLSYVNFSNNNIQTISNATVLPAVKYFYFSNNDLRGTVPVLDNIVENAEYINLDSNNYDNYTSGVEKLKKIRSLDLSANRIPTPAIDQILFDLVENYNSAPRASVLINLQGGSMGAPTPYPIISGILSSVSPITQPTISNGTIINLGSLQGFSPGSVPVDGDYSGVPLQNASGTGGKVNVSITSEFLDRPVTSIDTTPNLNVSGTLGEIKTIPGTYASSTLPGNFSAGYSGILSDQTPPSGGLPAQVEIVVDGTGSIQSITLINGGSGYTAQGTPDTITISDGVFNNANFVVNIGTVTEFTNGTYTRTDNNAPSGGTSASVNVTVSGGQITSSSLTTNPSGEGYELIDTIDVTIPATGDFSGTSNVSFDVNGIANEYYTNVSYAVSINTGGENYTAGQPGVTTANQISMRKTDGTIEKVSLGVNVNSVTSRTNRAVFTGFAAVEFLRSKGWSIQVRA